MGLPVCSLMSACFVVCVMHLVQVHAQNIEYDNDENVVTAMVSRLQDTVEQLFNHTVKQLRQDQQRSQEQFKLQCNQTMEELRQDHQRSTEQLLQMFNHSMVEQQKQLSKLETMLAEKSMYYLMIIPDNNSDNIRDLSVAPILANIKLFNQCS